MGDGQHRRARACSPNNVSLTRCASIVARICRHCVAMMATWRPQQEESMFLALRDLRRAWRRFVLVGSVVGLVAVLSTVLSGLADGLVRDGTSGLRALPVTHIAFAQHSEAVFSRSTLDERALSAWRRVPGVEATPVGLSF